MKAIGYISIFLLLGCNNTRGRNCTKDEYYNFCASHIQEYKTIGTTYFIDSIDKCVIKDSLKYIILEFTFTALNPNLNTLQTGNCKYILKCNRSSEIKLVDFSVEKTISNIPSNPIFQFDK